MATSISASDVASLITVKLALAKGSKAEQVVMAGKSITYTQADKDLIDSLILQYNIESGSVSLRTYAKQGGRGA